MKSWAAPYLAASIIALRFAAIPVMALAAGETATNGTTLPDCVHFTFAYVFEAYLDHAQVEGKPGQRLYFHQENPDLCGNSRAPECQNHGYLIPGDIVAVGGHCGQWSHVQFKRKDQKHPRPAVSGWVSSAQLVTLLPDQASLAERKRWADDDKDFRERESNPIVRAMNAGDIGLANRVAAKATTDELDEAFYKASSKASRGGQPELALALLDLGVDLSRLNSGCTFLTLWPETDPRVRSALLKKSPPINCATKDEKLTPLMATAYAMITGADPNDSNPDPNERLSDSIVAAHELISAGANVNAGDTWGESALRYAIRNNNIGMVTLLIASGADVENETSDANGATSTALMDAVSWYDLSHDPTVITLLLNHRANASYVSKVPAYRHRDCADQFLGAMGGESPLTYAAKSGYVTVVSVLLAHGADPAAPNFCDDSPLDAAHEYHQADAAALIKAALRHPGGSNAP